MATITYEFNVPDDKVIDFNDTLSDYLGYQEKIVINAGTGEEIDNPQSRANFIKAQVRLRVKGWYVAGKVEASKGVLDDARTDAETVDISEA